MPVEDSRLWSKGTYLRPNARASGFLHCLVLILYALRQGIGSYDDQLRKLEYGLLVLEVFLPRLPPGKYFVDRLQVTLDDDSEEIWDIGALVVDVRAGVQPRDIKVGRNTLGSTTRKTVFS